jgi:hypothetical protein
MFSRGSLCKSQCEDCGKACLAFRVSDIANIEQYSTLNCEIILGTLYISGVPQLPAIYLFKAFANVTTIHGDLVLTNNEGMISLDFFAKLMNVGNIRISGNPNLVDARIFSLANHGDTVIENNRLLCPNRETGTQIASEVGCNNVDVFQYLRLITTSPISHDAVKEICKSVLQQIFDANHVNFQVGIPIPTM